MKTLILLIASMLFALGAHAATFEKTAKSRTARVHIVSENPLHVGANTFVFDIKVKNKVPQSAAVAVRLFMPAMPGMPAMKSETRAKSLGGGRYEATLNAAMGGTWQMHIYITPKTGKKIRVKTSLNI